MNKVVRGLKTIADINLRPPHAHTHTCTKQVYTCLHTPCIHEYNHTCKVEKEGENLLYRAGTISQWVKAVATKA